MVQHSHDWFIYARDRLTSTERPMRQKALQHSRGTAGTTTMHARKEAQVSSFMPELSTESTLGILKRASLWLYQSLEIIRSSQWRNYFLVLSEKMACYFARSNELRHDDNLDPIAVDSPRRRGKVGKLARSSTGEKVRPPYRGIVLKLVRGSR